MAGRFLQYGVLLLLVQLAMSCAPAAPTQDEAVMPAPSMNASGVQTVDATLPSDKAIAADTRLIVAFGDSLYAGYKLGAQEGFAPALGRRLAALGVAPAQVINAGVPGDTSAAGLQRLAFVLDGLPRSPDLVIVGLGANDMLRGLPPEVTRDNIDAILRQLEERGITTILTGMLAAPNMGVDYAAKFDSLYPDLAQKYRVPLYPFFLKGVLGNREKMLADGIHPNAIGVAEIASNIAPIVAKSLEK